MKPSLTFSIYCNGYGLVIWLRAFDVYQLIQYVTGFQILKGNAPWRWVKIYKGDYGLMYSEGRKGKEIVGWKLRGPFEFTHVQGGL